MTESSKHLVSSLRFPHPLSYPSYYYPPIWETVSFHIHMINTMRNQYIFKARMYVVHRTFTPSSATSRYHVPNMNIFEVEVALESIQKNETLIWWNPKINITYIYKPDIISVLYHLNPVIH